MTLQVTFSFIGGSSATVRMEQTAEEIAIDIEKAIERRSGIVRIPQDKDLQVLNLNNMTVATIRRIT